MKLPDWSHFTALLEPYGKLMELSWTPDDDHVRAELYRQLVMNIALGYILHFQADPDHPDWAPYLNSIFMLQPNPDDCYLSASIDGRGAYRITGDRGTVYLLLLDVGPAFLGVPEKPQPKFSSYDLDKLAGPNGELDFIISAERPAGYTGDWLYLDPRAERFLVRQRSYDWGGEREARLTIERVDRFSLKPRLSIDETKQKLEGVLGIFTPWLTRMFLIHHQKIQEQGLINRFEFHNFTAGVPGQNYWETIFRFKPGEALILETELPAVRRYWNVQLNDPLFNAIEYVWRESSLNGHQAKIDSDGKFRAVLAHEDPGVPNWLDVGGYDEGTIIGRWLECDSAPTPAIKKVPFGEVRSHLPADTPVVDAATREAQLRARARGAQLRRRW